MVRVVLCRVGKIKREEDGFPGPTMAFCPCGMPTVNNVKLVDLSYLSDFSLAREHASLEMRGGRWWQHASLSDPRQFSHSIL